jgi:carbon starvation protein
MNSLFLLLIAGIIFVFGYRFFAKLLSIWVFRLDPKYSTTAEAEGDPEYGSSPTPILFAQHVAALAAVSTVLGSAMAIIWGWVPAFLMVVVASAVAGGTFGIGSLWISFRHQWHGPAHLSGVLFGPRVRNLLYLLFFSFLLILSVIAVNLLASLLSSYPTMVIPFWLQIPVALILAMSLKTQSMKHILGSSIAAIVFIALCSWFFDHTTVAIGGTLDLNVAGRSWLSINSHLIWAGGILIALYFAVKLPMDKLMRPRGYLAGLQLGLLLLLFLAGLVVTHPSLTAPTIHYPEQGPDILPWIFISITGGALSGFHLLLASGQTARQIRKESDAKLIGFGGALIDALVALSAIIIFASGFPDLPAWNNFYQSWEHVQNLPVLLQGYINGVATLLTHLGLSAYTARTLLAVIIGALLLTALESGLRLQKQILGELGENYGLAWLKDDKKTIGILLALLALAVIASRFLDQDNGFWSWFGLFNIIVTGIGFLLITTVLNGFQRALGFTLIPFMLLLLIGNWALIEQSLLWWGQNRWVLFTGGVLLFIIEIWVIFETFPVIRALTMKLMRPNRTD